MNAFLCATKLFFPAKQYSIRKKQYLQVLQYKLLVSLQELAKGWPCLPQSLIIWVSSSLNLNSLLTHSLQPLRFRWAVFETFILFWISHLDIFLAFFIITIILCCYFAFTPREEKKKTSLSLLLPKQLLVILFSKYSENEQPL